MKCSECLVKAMCNRIKCDYFFERVGLKRNINNRAYFNVNIMEVDDYPRQIKEMINEYENFKRGTGVTGLTNFKFEIRSLYNGDPLITLIGSLEE